MWGWASVRVAMAALIMTTGGATPAAAGPPPDTHESSLEVVADAASDDARLVMRWIAQTHDALGTPFAVVDKRNARIFKTNNVSNDTYIWANMATAFESYARDSQLI